MLHAGLEKRLVALHGKRHPFSTSRDTGAMSRENVENIKRAVAAFNRQDVEGMLEVHDIEVEWHPALQVLLGGEATVYRGHEGVRAFVRDQDEAFAEVRIELLEIRDLGDRLLAIGRLTARGKESGANVETPVAYVADFKNGKAVRIQSFFDPAEALEAAGLNE